MTMQEYFDLYDSIRDSGIMNMFLAPSFVAKEFRVDKEEAKEAFKEWCKSKKG